MKKSKMCIGILGVVLSTLMTVYTFLMIVFQQLFGGTGERMVVGLCIASAALTLAASIMAILFADNTKVNLISMMFFAAAAVICFASRPLRLIGALVCILAVLFTIIYFAEYSKLQEDRRERKKRKAPKRVKKIKGDKKEGSNSGSKEKVSEDASDPTETNTETKEN